MTGSLVCRRHCGCQSNTFTPTVAPVGDGVMPVSYGYPLPACSSAEPPVSLELAGSRDRWPWAGGSSPRVLTASGVEGFGSSRAPRFLTGEASSSGDQRVLQRRVLSLRVKPHQITLTAAGYSIEVKGPPALRADPGWRAAADRPRTSREVLIENGGTVVIGGIYEEEESTGEDKRVSATRALGHLFKSRYKVSNGSEFVFDHPAHRVSRRRAHAALSPALLLTYPGRHPAGCPPFHQDFRRAV